MTDRQARARLHKRLITTEDRPCAMCRSKEDREIHRIRPGYLGGKYTLANARVLCLDCHVKVHNKQKFGVGDSVQINGRCPKWLMAKLRHNRLRTITSVYYDAGKECCYYYLGKNNKGDSAWDIEAYPFRSYMLHHPLNRKVGRPKVRRHYLRLKCTEAIQEQNLGGFSPSWVVY